MSLLDVSKLTRNFGGLTAVFEADLHLDEGELIGLIGRDYTAGTNPPVFDIDGALVGGASLDVGATWYMYPGGFSNTDFAASAWSIWQIDWVNPPCGPKPLISSKASSGPVAITR